jgi:hypothetical protein
MKFQVLELDNANKKQQTRNERARSKIRESEEIREFQEDPTFVKFGYSMAEKTRTNRYRIENRRRTSLGFLNNLRFKWRYSRKSFALGGPIILL